MMNSAAKRILSALLLLAIFALALFLRFHGLDWGFKDGSYSQHPDEWHYDGCAGDLHPQGLTPEERQLPLREQLQLLYERNLKIDAQSNATPGLKIRNYNYGTLPLYLYVLYKAYLVEHFHGDDGWVFLAFPDWLSLVLLTFVLWLGLRMFGGLSRDLREIDGRRIPWYQDEWRLFFFFPCLLIPITGLVLAAYFPNSVVDFSKYTPATANILIIGRVVTAYLGALTVLLAYLIGRDAYNRATGLIGATMLATAMLHVQTSHFATTDVILGFWTTAAVYCFLKISQKPRLLWYVLGAICTGFAVGTKWSGITLPGILFLAHAIAVLNDERQGKSGRWIHGFWLTCTALVLAHFFHAAQSSHPPVDVSMAAFRDFYGAHVWFFGIVILILVIASLYWLILRKRWHGGEVGWFLPAVRIYRPWIWLGVAIGIGFCAFMAAEPMAYFDAKLFGSSVAEQQALNMTGTQPMVYTQQYRHTLPVLYTLDNLFYPSLDWLTAFFVIGGCLYALGMLYKKGKRADLLLSAWVVPSFLLYGCAHSKFPRYMDTILPVMVVMGGRWIVDLARIQPSLYTPSLPNLAPGWKRLARGIGRYGGAAALLCGLVYGVSYVGIYDRPHTLVQAGDWIREHMKSGAKVTQNSWDNPFGIHIESRDCIGIHDNPEQDIRDPQARVQYLANRLKEYDYIVFPSKRGYGTTLRNPDRFPITNQFLRALFAEQLGFKVAKVIDNPPRFLGWEFRCDTEDETARIYDHPKVIIFEKTKNFSEEQLRDMILNPPDWVNRITDRELLELQDGHPVFAPPPHHPLLHWMVTIYGLGWIGFLLLFPLVPLLPDRGYGISKVVGMALFSWLIWFLASTGIMKVSPLGVVFILGGLLLAAGVVCWIHGAEIRNFLAKKWLLLMGMEILFLLIWGFFLMVRAEHPAAIGGEKPMNMAFINAVYRAETFPPEDPWISGFPVNYYYYGHAVVALMGRFAGLPPEYLFNIGGTTISALAALAIFTLTFTLSKRWLIALFATYLSCFAGHFLSYLNFVKYELIFHNRPDAAASIGIREWIGALTPITKQIWHALLYYTGFASPEVVQSFNALNYDQLFWASSRVIPNTVANEFPYWTHLFLDFHAHMLVIPFSFAFFVLLYHYFAQPHKAFRLGNTLGLTFFLGLLLGTVICTNTWDLPALAIALLLITTVKFSRESEYFGGASVRPEWLSGAALQRLLVFPIAPVALIVFFAILLFIPFHVNFVSRVSSVGIMMEGNTLLSTYLGFWAHLLFPILIAAILFAVVRHDGRLSTTRAMIFATFYMLSVAVAIWLTRVNLFHFPPPADPQHPLNYTIVGLFLPILLVWFLLLWRRNSCPEFVFACLIGVLGLGLSLGIELFYMKEYWTPPTHRWNTAFKFDFQIWHYFSILAAISCVWIWDLIRRMSVHIGKWFSRTARPAFLFAMMIVLIPTLPFAVMAPVLVTQSSGYLPDNRGPRPSLDGLAYLREENPGGYHAVQWCNRFLTDRPHIVEISYRHGGDHARFSSYTGLPALIGWPHHTRERMSYVSFIVDERVRDMGKIYTSDNPEEVLRLAGQYDIQYLIFGQIERETKRGDQQELPPLGEKGLQHLEEKMGGILQLVYRNEDTSIFKFNRSLNRFYGMETQANSKPVVIVPPAMTQETGVSMLDGKKGNENGCFDEPRGIALDPEGNFYVADTRNYRIQVFHPDGAFAWKFGQKGSDENQLDEPNDVTIDPQNGNIYIADSWNHRVDLYDKRGMFLGASQPVFFGPRGIVFHPKWRLLFITDTGNHRIVSMTPDGQILQTWGHKGGANEDDAFSEPVGIDVLPDNRLVIVDSLNRRVKIYKPEGIVDKIWPIQTDWNGEGGFESHVACSSDGKIYLTDPKEGSVHIYTADGELIEKIRTDVNQRALGVPVGIALTADGSVWVGDLLRSQIVHVR